MDGFAEALRALMAERGISGNALARRVPCDKAHISHLKNGQQRPSRRIAERLDEILGAGGKLAALSHDEPPNGGVSADRSALAGPVAEQAGAMELVRRVRGPHRGMGGPGAAPRAPGPAGLPSRDPPPPR